METLLERIKGKIQLLRVHIDDITTNSYYNITHEEIIKDVLKNDPLAIMNKLLAYVSNTEIIKEINLECDDIGEGNYERSEIYSKLKLNEFYKIMKIKLGICGILEGHEPETYIYDGYDFKIDFNKIYFNSYSKNIELRGIFEGESYIMNTLDDSKIAIKLYVTGIKNDIIIPSWVEYLIEGLFNISYNNYKMAFFYICAGFDNFINEIYDDVFDYYLEYYSQCKNNNVKLEVKEKIREFATKEKRLRNKLIGIFKELKMNKKHGFEELNSLFEIWDKKYVVTRDKIAHGGVYNDDYNLEDVAYTILTIIFSILLHENLAENEWKSIIEF